MFAPVHSAAGLKSLGNARFGARRAEVTVGWLLRKTISVDLEPRDVERLKQALRSRRATRGAALQSQK